MRWNECGSGVGRISADTCRPSGGLAPFFTKNAATYAGWRAGADGMMGWIIFFTMAAGWVIDVLMSRGMRFIRAGIAEMKRPLFTPPAIIFELRVHLFDGFGHRLQFELVPPRNLMALLVVLLLVVALRPRSYGYSIFFERTSRLGSFLFCRYRGACHRRLSDCEAHHGLQASGVATDFVDRRSPRIAGRGSVTKQELAAVESARDATRAKIADLQNQIAQAGRNRNNCARKSRRRKIPTFTFSAKSSGRAPGARSIRPRPVHRFSGQISFEFLNALAGRNWPRSATSWRSTRRKSSRSRPMRPARRRRREPICCASGKRRVTLSECGRFSLQNPRASKRSAGAASETASDSWAIASG